MSHPLNLGIIGAGGRMGRALLQNAHAASDLHVSAAIEHPGSENLGARLGPQGIQVSGDLASVVSACDVLIDFSTPQSCLDAARQAANAGKPFVTGTTVLRADNFSVGVNVLARLVELASRACGEDFDLEIFESHHKHKVDAPSGTALMLGKAAARGRGQELEDVATWARHGQTGARQPGSIGFQVLRGGDIVGEHTVFACGDGERLELTHRATDRGIFARGALRAARWTFTKKSGLYTMQDVLFSN